MALLQGVWATDGQMQNGPWIFGHLRQVRMPDQGDSDPKSSRGFLSNLWNLSLQSHRARCATSMPESNLPTMGFEQ